MLRVLCVPFLALSLNVIAGNLDVDFVMEKINEVNKDIEAEPIFYNKFAYLDELINVIEAEKNKVTDENYDIYMDELFTLNIFSSSLKDIREPFQRSDCEYKKSSLIYSYKGNQIKIPSGLEKDVESIISVLDSICGNTGDKLGIIYESEGY